MSERKVLTKYYPPDFDPRQIQRTRAPKSSGPRVQTVRLMAPYSMQCTSCGEYIYKGRKFNARKETPQDEKYLGIQIYRFYIRCTRCSAEITFKTDPKNLDYVCEKGAKRNTEPWRRPETAEETDEQRLDRLEAEREEEEGVEGGGAAAARDRNAMQELEAKTADARREMAVADALDEIRTRNARMERSDGADPALVAAAPAADADAERQDREDAEAARRAFDFARRAEALVEEVPGDVGWVVDGGAGMASISSSSPTSSSSSSSDSAPAPAPNSASGPATSSSSTAASASASKDMPPPSFKRVVKKKKDHSALLGIKKKPSLI